jgi:hypothetical protein
MNWRRLLPIRMVFWRLSAWESVGGHGVHLEVTSSRYFADGPQPLKRTTDGLLGMATPTAAGPRRGARRRLVALALAVGVLAVLPGRTGAEPAVPTTLATTLLRAMSYDVNLKARAGATVVLVVLHRATASPSRRESTDILKAFKELEAVTVQGLPFRVVSLAVTDAPTLEQGARTAEASIFFVCTGLDDEIPMIKEIAHKLKIRTAAGKEALVDKGISLAVDPEVKPSLIVNLKESREEGAFFTSALLRLAKVIK